MGKSSTATKLNFDYVIFSKYFPSRRLVRYWLAQGTFTSRYIPFVRKNSPYRLLFITP